MTAATPGIVSSDMLATHLQEIIVEYDSYKKQVRRADSRESVSIPVEAIPLDEDLIPSGPAFHMVTRDISVGGCGVFHTAAIEQEYLQLQFCSPVSLEAFGVYAKVEHCTPCGKYFIIGCRFLTDRGDA